MGILWKIQNILICFNILLEFLHTLFSLALFNISTWRGPGGRQICPPPALDDRSVAQRLTTRTASALSSGCGPERPTGRRALGAELSCSLARWNCLILAAVRQFIINELKSDNRDDLPLSDRPDEFRDGLE